MSFRVRLTREAEADLDRLFDFVLERERHQLEDDYH
jgi:plasmid stabilization system protein ParE